MNSNRHEKPRLRLLSTYVNALQALVGALFVFVFAVAGWLYINSRPAPPVAIAEARQAEEEDFDRVENGIHVATGLPFDDNFAVVRAQCTACHSAKLITQNRATRDGWKEMIRWMQKTQKLWDLGEQEERILDYLAAHYAPKASGRRRPLANIEWYELP